MDYSKKFKKVLDKLGRILYNKYRKQERIPKR